MMANVWYGPAMGPWMRTMPRRGPRRAHRAASERQWLPAVDVAEDNKNYYLFIELPGLDKEAVKVRYEDGTLVIKGEKKQNDTDDALKFHHRERAFGEFERQFELPENVTVNEIQARFQNGLLTVTLPKREESGPRPVEVKIQ